MKKSQSIRLRPELVPEPLWGQSAYRLLGRGSAWKRIRADALATTDRSCQCCGARPSTVYGDPLFCHEKWQYDDKRRVATLIGFEVHCIDCDAATHIGRSMMHGSGERALAQLCKVNGITLKESERLFMEAMAVWRKRSEKKWRITVEKSLLERYPRLSILCT